MGAQQVFCGLKPAAGGGGPDVAVDTQFASGNTAQSSGFNFAGTVGNNSNRLLVACAQFAQTGISAVGITYGGVTMTAVGTSQTAGGRMQFVFQLVAPATGSNTLACTWTGGSSTIELGAVSYYNVNQSTPVQNDAQDTATSNSASSTVTSAAGNAVFVSHMNNNASSTTLSAGTTAWLQTAFDGNYAGASRLSTSGSTVVTWSLGSSVAWGNIRVDVVKA